jgi:antitoxin component YwqK of YwqJK toxin-antitoxin module
MNHPNLHFEMNEAWILSGDDADETPRSGGKIKQYEEKYSNGSIKARWSAKTTNDGRYLLDGDETWYYENGRKKWQVSYSNGRKVGSETYWLGNGQKKWLWQHNQDGTSTWTQWWPNGKRKAESTWRNARCEGAATRWDPQGNVISRIEFVDGRPTGRESVSRKTGR